MIIVGARECSMSEKKSKRYRSCLEKIPKEKIPISQAVGVIKSFETMKFDSTVELTMHLGIDPKHADQALRGSIALPNGIGVSRKVIAFCADQDIEAAKSAGAIEAGSDDLVKKIQDGWMDFDVAVSTPAMMKVVSRLGKVLGPQGKMPSPKAGTVCENIADAVTEFAAGKVEYRNDDGGNLHVPVGKVSFEPQKLTENIDAFVTHIKRIKPSSAKGTYIKRACLSATMSPSIQLDV